MQKLAGKSWSPGGSHEKRQPFKKILHRILVVISSGMQKPSPWTCLHPGQFGNGEKSQEWVCQGASHSANALPCSRAGRALGLANTAGAELQITTHSLLLPCTVCSWAALALQEWWTGTVSQGCFLADIMLSEIPHLLFLGSAQEKNLMTEVISPPRSAALQVFIYLDISPHCTCGL